MQTQQQHRLLDEPYYCSNPAFFFPELHIHRASQKPCEICLATRKQEIKKSIWLVGWLAGWLAKKCQPFFFHELHKNLREICITSKQERQQEVADFLCFLLADKCKRG